MGISGPSSMGDEKLGNKISDSEPCSEYPENTASARTRGLVILLTKTNKMKTY